VGAAVLARSLVKARRAIPVLPCEPHFAPVIEAAVRGIGLVPVPAAGLDLARLHPGDPVCVIEATDDTVDAGRWLAARAPALVIAIERPGRSATGVYHNMSGRNVGHCLNNFEDLFLRRKAGDLDHRHRRRRQRGRHGGASSRGARAGGVRRGLWLWLRRGHRGRVRRRGRW
jgi:hypothetical protein